MRLLENINKFFNPPAGGKYSVYRPDMEMESLKDGSADEGGGEQVGYFVYECLDHLAAAARELDTLKNEFSLVTSCLTDLEEIRGQPEEVKAQLKTYALRIMDLENDMEKPGRKHDIMPPEDYLHMERLKQYMPDGYNRLKEAEDYHALVMGDIGKLEGERYAHYFRKNELQNIMQRIKGITFICAGSMFFLMLMLAFLGTAWHLDVSLGYAAAALTAATTLMSTYVKFHRAQQESMGVEKGINRLALLYNTVKIRYVNNLRLLEYLYAKYDVESSRELKNLWDRYLEENIRREQAQQINQELDSGRAALTSLLHRCNITHPDIWLCQTTALTDNKEMARIRHRLIIRRQELRNEMNRTAQEAQDTARETAGKYPEYAEMILNIVSGCEKTPE